MATVNFYPRSKTGTSKINVRISIGRYKNYLLSTRISVPDVKMDWDVKKKMARNPKTAKFLTVLKTKLLNHIADVEIDLNMAVSDIPSDDFRKIIYDVNKVPKKQQSFKRKSSKGLAAYIDRFVAKCEKKGYRTKGNRLKTYSQGTLAKYRQLKSTVQLFEKEEGSTLELNSFDSKAVDAFESFLTEQYAVSTAGRKLKSLKTVLTAAYNAGEQVNPHFRNIKGFTYETTVVPLTEQEQEIIFATPMPSDIMEHARDWLLILCGTGQRFSDANALTKENISNGAIQVTQKKTGATVEIPIFDRVQRIIDKYDGFPPRFSDNDGSQNAHLNKTVKKVCKECSIDEVLKESKNGKYGEYRKYELITTKTGRKSLATYLYKTLRWDAQSCMHITGHAQIENFMIYVGGKNSAINEANKLRVSEINKKTVENRTKNMKISS